MEKTKVKQNWEQKKLGDTFNFIDYRGMTPNKIDNGIPLITAKNVRMGYLDYSIKDYISESDYKKRQTRGIAHKGDILFTTEAPLGYSAIADLEVFSTGQRIITFQQFENEKRIFNPFFNYYFQSIEFQTILKENATGLTASGIKAARLKELLVPFPPLEEQKRIVAVLDKKFAQIETLKTAAEKNLQNTKQLFQAELEKAFKNSSFENIELKNLITLLSGQDFPPEKYNANKIGLPYITGASNFADDGSIIINRWTDTPTVIAKEKDILLVVKGSGYGKVAFADFKEAHIARQIMALRVNECVERVYLFYYLKCQFEEIKKKGNGVIPGITRSDVLEMTLNLPSLEEQKRIVAHLDSLSEKVHQLEEIYTKQLADCDELKQSFLQKAFEGEL